MSEHRILIVEADTALANQYREALQNGGLTVDVTSDVDRAAEHTTSQSPDLLVLGADPRVGDAVCRTVKKKGGKRTPVLLVSANAAAKGSLFGAHPDIILQKPVSADVLLRSVANLLKIEVPDTPPPHVDEIPLDENLLEIVEEARPKEPIYSRRKTIPPTVTARAAATPAEPPRRQTQIPTS